jgi:hypothetical protein
VPPFSPIKIGSELLSGINHVRFTVPKCEQTKKIKGHQIHPKKNEKQNNLKE